MTAFVKKLSQENDQLRAEMAALRLNPDQLKLNKPAPFSGCTGAIDA